jgi:hypothetical protein
MGAFTYRTAFLEILISAQEVSPADGKQWWKKMQQTKKVGKWQFIFCPQYLHKVSSP